MQSSANKTCLMHGLVDELMPAATCKCDCWKPAKSIQAAGRGLYQTTLLPGIIWSPSILLIHIKV